MNATVQICGVDYPSCELIQHHTFYGIKTTEKVFWLFPICDDGGREAKSLPPYLPCVIRSVTLEPPDLTESYPDTVKELFDKRRTYFSTATLAKYQAQYSDAFWLTEERFQQERNRILGEALEDFVHDLRVRQMVWDRYGTVELANQAGYLGDVYETETLADGTQRKFMTKASVAMSLFIRIMEARKISKDAAWTIVSNLKYVMIYEDVPTKQFIYLEGMKMSASPPFLTPLTPQLKVNVNVESHNQITNYMHWPDETLEEIQNTTQQMLAMVTQIHSKKQAKERKWHQKGGRATSKWVGHEKEASELARVMRQFRDHFIRDNRTKRGASRWAYASGRAWWKKKFKGALLENFLDEEKVSNANLDRLMRKDFRKNRKATT